MLKSGHGVTLKYDLASLVITDGDVPTWVDMNCLTELGDYPKKTLNNATVVCHDDPEALEKKVRTTKSLEAMSFSVALDTSSTAHRDLMDLYDSGDIVSWQLGLPDAGNYTVVLEGYVSDFDPTSQSDEVLTAEFTIEPTAGPQEDTP